MKPVAPVLPPGRSLTDVWPHLSLRDKIRWLQVVEREAGAVRGEAAAARRRAEMSMLEPEAAVKARRDILEHEAGTFRVGRPRRTVRP